jgi:hypothetical protein
MDELERVKNKLMTEISVQYKNLIDLLSNLPVSEKFKEYGFQNLDQGIMWFQKSIELLQRPTPSEVLKNPESEQTETIQNVTIN